MMLRQNITQAVSTATLYTQTIRATENVNVQNGTFERRFQSCRCTRGDSREVEE